MNDRLSNSFMYEHCDVPQGQSLAEWRTSRAAPARRPSRVAGVMFAAVATRAPGMLAGRTARGLR